MFHSESLGQKVTAGLMVAIDMAGEIGLFSADTLYLSAQSSMITRILPILNMRCCSGWQAIQK
ncbi:MAG: hypothetical protein WAN58_01195 [Anaerolineales bacterium]